jgi:DNA polymerase III delta prime subunit
MKKKFSQTGKENIRLNNNKSRPEIRDNLDSREHLEQQLKGNDITHNKKETRKPEKKTK